MEKVKGIKWFNIQTGEERYTISEAQISAMINSSDMGINASRGQDFSWRLDPEYVKLVKNYRNNENKMSLLASNTDGPVDDVKILFAIYTEQIRAAQARKQEERRPFEAEYLRKVNEAKSSQEQTSEGGETYEPKAQASKKKQ